MKEEETRPRSIGGYGRRETTRERGPREGGQAGRRGRGEKRKTEKKREKKQRWVGVGEERERGIESV